MISPLDILTGTAKPAAKPARVDADTFAKLCERPDAQRFIVDGSINGVIVDGAEYTIN